MHRYTKYDFQRLHLYRDINVYKEVGRRAALVCGGGKLPGMMSTAEWMTAVKADAPTGTAAGSEPGTLGASRKMLVAAAEVGQCRLNR